MDTTPNVASRMTPWKGSSRIVDPRLDTLADRMSKRSWFLAAAGIVLVGSSVLVIRNESRSLPAPLREDFRSEFVSDEDGYRFWPRSAHVEEGVTYLYDTGHCGLDVMLDFDGTFWHAVNANAGEEPVFFYNQDLGTIEQIGNDLARYTSSSGEEIRLERMDGPIVTHPCA
jgi:hypothetical protein